MQIVLLGMHGFQCMFFFRDEKFLLKAVRILSLSKKILDNWIADCLVWRSWFALSVFFHDGKFLLDALGILSLSKYT